MRISITLLTILDRKSQRRPYCAGLDRLSSRLRRWINIALGAPILFFFLPMTYITAGSYKTTAMCTITQTWGTMNRVLRLLRAMRGS